MEMPKAAGDALAVTLSVTSGTETYSRAFTVGELRAMGKAPLASEIACILCCSKKAGTIACIARCLIDGKCCDGGTTNCQDT